MIRSELERGRRVLEGDVTEKGRDCGNSYQPVMELWS